LITIIARPRRVVEHAPFMADSRQKYKYGILDRGSDAVTRYKSTSIGESVFLIPVRTRYHR
jgi:hypothetical protein